MALRETLDWIGMSMRFDDADPVVQCLIGECQEKFHGDSQMDAIRGWARHVSKEHRKDWDGDNAPIPVHKTGKDRDQGTEQRPPAG